MSFSKHLKAHHKEILVFAAPVVLSMVIQNFMGVFDNALAGIKGTEALAAYGIAFFLLFIHAAPLMGLATAVQTLTANAYGRGEKNRTSLYLWSASAVSVTYGLLLFVAGEFYLHTLLSKMTSDSQVLALASEYLRMRFVGIFAIGLNHAFRGYWNGVGEPKVFLKIMGASYLFNAVLSYTLITGKFGLPEMGFVGLGVGSTGATILASVANFWVAHRRNPTFGLRRQNFDQSSWRNLFSQSVPSALQQLLFALSFAILFAIIGRLGAPSLAAANVLVSISLFLIYPGMAMGMTASTFVARSLGARDGKAKFWTKHVAVVSSGLFLFASILLLVFNEQVLSIFIRDANVRDLAKVPLLLFAGTLVLEILGQIYTFALLGAGKPGHVLAVTMIIQWLVILPLCYFLGSDLNAIWTIQTAARCLQALILMGVWRSQLSKLSAA